MKADKELSSVKLFWKGYKEMKRLSLKLAMAFILAVCSLAGCEKTDSVQGNDEKQSTAASVLTTASVSSESTSTMDATSADETTAVQPTQTEAPLQDKTEAASVEGSISGETYVTELVPGIIDEEQRTEESFNIRDYSA